MTEIDIQKEIDQRVKFKMEQFFIGMENRIKHNKRSEFSLVLSGDYRNGEKAQNYKEAWEQVKQAFLKETNLPPLSEKMYENAKEQAHRKAADMLIHKLEEDNRGREHWQRGKQKHWTNFILKAIKTAQDF